MQLYYSLSKRIDCQKLCMDVANFVEKFRRENTDKNVNTSILTISINPITHTTNNHMPRIESKQKQE
jgi:hypothetical protein